MKSPRRSFYIKTAWLLLLLLSGCTTLPPAPLATDQRYGLFDETSLAGRYAPVIAPYDTQKAYNRIGRAAARLDADGEEQIYIASDEATFYVAEQPFVSRSGRQLRNLIYRFHFPYVPQPHLTAGDNGGLIIVITLDEQGRPLLISSVHSCGCYLAIVPTSYLPASAYPPDWNDKRQSVFGETLSGRLDYPVEFSTELRPVIRLRSGTHRVMDIGLGRAAELQQGITTVSTAPMAALERLPLNGGQTSFFHEAGPLKGYVKGGFKPWELLLMSWWALDLNIGRDKRLGDPAETGTVFYTSLKPWARDESNMWFFADFLAYWGWDL